MGEKVTGTFAIIEGGKCSLTEAKEKIQTASELL